LLGVSDLQTTTPFTASQSGLAVTLSGGAGTAATATVDTDGSGNITAVTITGSGSDYAVGNVITVTEVGGTPGVGTFTVAALA